MANLLPYAIVAGIAVVFFVVCYILFSGGSSEKEEKKGKNRHSRAASERPGQGKSSLGYDEAEKRRSAQPQQPVREDTAPIPRISNVTVRERQENPDETAFVTTKGEAVRRDGKIVYEEPHRPAKKQEHLDATQVLSREEILEAMDKIDKEEAAAHKAKEEEAKKKDMAETLRSAKAAERSEGEREDEEAPRAALADMAAVVAADLEAKSQGEAAARPGRRIVQEVMAETAKAAAKSVSDETQVISPAELRRKQEETAAAADETVMFDAGRLSDAVRQTGAAPASDETAVMPPVRQHTHTDAGNETKQQKSPWGNDLSRSAAKAAPMAFPASIRHGDRGYESAGCFDYGGGLPPHRLPLRRRTKESPVVAAGPGSAAERAEGLRGPSEGLRRGDGIAGLCRYRAGLTRFDAPSRRRRRAENHALLVEQPL